PTIEVNDSQCRATEENYAKNDPEQSNKHLHYAEKLAITAYSGTEYFPMQRFLRNFAKKETEGKGNVNVQETPQAILNRVNRLRLGIAIASHGLSKPLSVALDPNPASFEVLQRGEVTVETVDTQRQQDAKEKKVTSNPGFISTTSDTHTAEDFSTSEQD